MDSSWRLFEACQLQPKETTRDNYAADLQKSLRGELSSVSSAEQFFQSTFPAGGMRDVCGRIFNRLSVGDASNEPSVYRLGTAFGGGKTHTLIALAGASQFPDLIVKGVTPIPAETVPSAPVRLATFTGENSDVERGAVIPGSNGLRAKSLIGQLAWQLGGKEAFEDFRVYDRNLTSPGSEDLHRLIGYGPCLILIDELVQWLDRIDNSGLDSGLQNVRTLFSSLAKAVEQSPNAALVITTPDPAGDAYRGSTQLALDVLNELDSILARIAYQAIPTDTPDVPAILRRRLFSSIEETARNSVAEAYASLWSRSRALITPPPPDQTVKQWFYDHYPIHPDTLSVIVEKVAANPNFQRTRGILRLLGKAVHHLKASDHAESALLIHPHHIDPAFPEINAELTTRIEHVDFASAIEADITSPDSTAERIDQTRPTKPARRIARAALLASLAPLATARGATPGDLVRAAVTPRDEDPSVIANAVTEFRNQALYVNDDPNAHRIEFTTVQNLNRLLLERRSAVTAIEISDHVKQSITDCFAPAANARTRFAAAIFPSGSDIPDNSNSVGLGVLNYEWIDQSSTNREAVLANFYRNRPLSGSGERPREYKNNLLILVADPVRANDLTGHARRFIAAQSIKQRPPPSLLEYQQKSLELELASARKDLYVAIQKLYANLYYPSTDATVSESTLLQHQRISPELAAEKPGDGQFAVTRTLIDRQKLITADNAALNPDSYWTKRRNLAKGKVPLTDIREEFAREPGNYMVPNDEVALAVFRKALDSGRFIIQTGSGQVIREGSRMVRLDYQGAYAYLASNACPKCWLPETDCRCKVVEPELCDQCGQIKHDGPCQLVEPFKEIPDFGCESRPLNVVVKELRRHAQANDATVTGLESVTLYGGDAGFINFMISLIGQSLPAQVNYELHGAGIRLEVADMKAEQWSSVMARVAPVLERDADPTRVELTIPFRQSDEEAIDRLLDQFPGTHEGGIKASFKQRKAVAASGE